MAELSVVIATHNRARSLAGCLLALSELDFPKDGLEIIVADNGSTDDTQFVAESFKKMMPRLRYLFDPRPGQMVGWHRGLAIAEAEIIAFIDDDVRPLPRWAAAAVEIFSDPAVGLGTGNILPAFDDRPPRWHHEMIRSQREGSWSALWGMLDFGKHAKDIPAEFVWGSNFLARKSALIEAGGFRPAGMPRHLYHFTGDSDVAAGRNIQALGYRAHFHPDAAVAHQLPGGRNSADEVERWIYGEGLVMSYVMIRDTAETEPYLSGAALAEAAARRLGAQRIAAIGQGYLKSGSTLPGDITRVMEPPAPPASKRTKQRFGTTPHFANGFCSPIISTSTAATGTPASSQRTPACDRRAGRLRARTFGHEFVRPCILVLSYCASKLTSPMLLGPGRADGRPLRLRPQYGHQRAEGVQISLVAAGKSIAGIGVIEGQPGWGQVVRMAIVDQRSASYWPNPCLRRVRGNAIRGIICGVE